MADVELRSLRVTADLDASGYAAGAQQKAAADAKMSASGAEATRALAAHDQKVSQSGDVLARLSRQYIDGYASAQRFQSALTSLSRGIDQGRISMDQALPVLDGIYKKYGLIADAAQFAARGQAEFATAVTRANARVEQQRGITPANANARGGPSGLNNFAAFNAGQQLQDIAVTAAMGQSIPTIALQQGLQLGSSLQLSLGNQGATGIISVLRGAITSLFNPINLIAVGFTAAAAAAIKFGSAIIDRGKSIEEVLKGHKALIDEITKSYPQAAAAAKQYEDQAKLLPQSVLGANTANQLKDETEAYQKALRDFRVQFNLLIQGDTGQADFARLGKAGAAAMAEISKGIKTGQIDAIALQRRFGELRIDPSLSKNTRDFYGQLQEAVNKAAELERNLQGSAAAGHALAGGFNGPGGLPLFLQPGAGDFTRNRAASDQETALSRAQRQHEAELASINARSPEERASAARSQAAANVVQGETPAERQQRIQLAGDRALIEAEHSLKLAQEERMRSLDSTLASQQLDLSLIGKTGSEAEALRLQFQLTQQLREEAARNNTKVDRVELDAIKAKAEAYGKMAEQIAHAKLQDDLGFQLRQVGRSPEDQNIASQLRAANLPENLNSADAAAIRFTDHIKQMADAWKGVQKEGSDAIDQIENSLLDGGKNIKETMLNIGKTFLKSIVDLDLTNPLKNKLYGTQLPTLQDVGGIGGFFKALFGGKQDLPNKVPGLPTALSSMQVTAASVFINGSPLGIPGLPGTSGLPGLPGGLNTPATAAHALSQLGSPLGVANDNAGPTGLYAKAIKSIESGSFAGNYNALGPITGSGDRAYGAYQMMGANIGPWSKQVLGHALTPDQFLGNKDAQDAIFSKIFGGYANKFGPTGAAQAWFGGPGSVGRGGMGADLLGTTGSAYVDKFTDAMTKATSGLGTFDGGISKVGQSLLGNLLPGGNSGGNGLFDVLKDLGPDKGQNSSGPFSTLLKMLSGGDNNSAPSLPGLPSLPGAFPAAPSLSPGASLTNGIMSIFKMFGSLFGLGGLGGSALSPIASLSVLLGGGGLYANGAAFLGGNVVPFANGDVLTSPARFPMSGGRTGLMGEAGPEAIMPLRRGSDGRLGVAMHGAGNQQSAGLSPDHIKSIVDAVASKVSLSVKNVNVLDPSIVGDYLRTDEGEQLIMNTVQRNKAA